MEDILRLGGLIMSRTGWSKLGSDVSLHFLIGLLIWCDRLVGIVRPCEEVLYLGVGRTPLFVPSPLEQSWQSQKQNPCVCILFYLLSLSDILLSRGNCGSCLSQVGYLFGRGQKSGSLGLWEAWCIWHQQWQKSLWTVTECPVFEKGTY